MRTGRNLSKFTGMARNYPKSDPRWNGEYSGTGLHTGTKNFGCSGRNETVLITMKKKKKIANLIVASQRCYSILYRIGWYGRYFPYQSLKQYRNTCVSLRFKYQLYRVVPATSDEIAYFGQKNCTGLEHDFQIKRKEKFLDPVSLPSFRYILTSDLSLCYCRHQKITATLPESHFVDLLLLPLLLR